MNFERNYTFICPKNTLYLYLRVFFFSLLILGLTNISAQSQNLDSLENITKTSKYDEQKAIAYQKLAWHYRNMSLKKSLDYAHAGLALTKNFTNRKIEADITRTIGVIYLHYVYHHESLEWNQKALLLSQEIDYEEGVGFCYDNFGVNSYYQKKYTRALENFERALAIFEKLNHKEGMGYSYTHLGWVYMEQKQYQKALDYTLKALELRRKVGNIPPIAGALRDLARIYERMGNTEKAQKAIKEAIDIIYKTKTKPFLDEHLQALAHIYIDVNLDSAYKYTQLSEYFVNQRGNKRQKVHVYKLYYQIFLKKNDIPKAMEYQDLHYAYKDSIYNDDIDRNNASLAAKFEYDQKEKLLVLEQKQKRAEIENQLQNQRWVIYTILLILLFLILLGYVFYRNFIEKQKFVDKLAKSNLELKQLNAQIDQQNEELTAITENLKEMDAFKDKLFSIISHDLRSPLAQVQGTLSILESGLLEQDEFMAIVPSLAKSIQVSSELLTNLLSWAKSQMSGQTIEKQNFDIQETIDVNVKLFEKTSQSKGILLKSSLEKPLFVLGDKNMIDLVIRNLTNNAVKFCKKGNEITISAQETDAQGKDKNMVKVCIADTGVGISEKNIDKLFANKGFTQKGTSGEKGTGLGLTLCKDFIEKNGGRIWVESKEGEGSRFYFTLPVV